MSANLFEGVDIVCLGSVDWLLIHSTAENTMLGLSKSHRVLYVEPFNSLITLLRVARSQARKYERRGGLRHLSETFTVYSPPPIGVPGLTRWKWPARINAWILAWLLKRVMKKLAIQDPVLYTYLYESADLVRRLPARLSVYEVLDQDETLAKDERHRRLIREHEEAVCRQVDMVVGITEELASQRRPYNAQTYVANGGADLEFFGRALLDSTPVPSDIACLPKPILGYMGSLDPWKMDVELITHIARANPECSVVLVGFVWYGFDPRQFDGCPNIHVLGPKEYEDFPGYLKGMDVCLMPFPLNGITLNGDAIKLYEYLAAGKPVVSTSVPAARRFCDVVRIAESKAAFVEAIRCCLNEPEDATAIRLERIRFHSWSHRVELHEQLVESRLRMKAEAALEAQVRSSK